MGLGLDDVQCRLQSLRVRRASGCLEETPCQPAAEALLPNRPCLAVAVDLEIGEAGSVRRMEQLRLLREGDQDVGLLRAAPATISRLIGGGLIVGGVLDIGGVLDRRAVALRLGARLPLGVVKDGARREPVGRRGVPVLPALVAGTLIELGAFRRPAEEGRVARRAAARRGVDRHASGVPFLPVQVAVGHPADGVDDALQVIVMVARMVGRGLGLVGEGRPSSPAPRATCRSR